MSWKRFLFWLMLVLVVISPFLLAELSTRIFLFEYVHGQEDMSYLVSAMESSFIKTKTINGRSYFYSDYLPVKYYLADKSTIGRHLVAEKTDSVYRILTLGGSSNAGSPFGNWGSFSRFLLDGLDSVKTSGSRVEVFNCGISSGTTVTALLMFERLLFLRPDLIIVYAGHNEGVDFVPGDANEKLRQEAEHFGKLKREGHSLVDTVAKFIYGHSYAFRLLNILYHRWKQDAPEVENYRPFEMHPESARILKARSGGDLKEIAEHYRENLESIIGLANQVGSDVLLLTQPANMFIAPEDYRDSDSASAESLDRLAEAMSSAEHAQVLNVFSEVLEKDADSPLAHYLMGLYLLQRGSSDEAGAHLTLAMELDRLPRRFRPITYTRILRELASKHSNTWVVDIYQGLDELLTDRLVDGRLVLDVMHPTMELHKYIAIKIMEEHFIPLDLRSDLFDYSRYRRAGLLGPLAEEELYGLTCPRYSGYSEDWEDCLRKRLEDLLGKRKAGDVAAIRREQNIWESLFYYGRVNNEGWALSEAIKTFQPWTLER